MQSYDTDHFHGDVPGPIWSYQGGSWENLVTDLPLMRHLVSLEMFDMLCMGSVDAVYALYLSGPEPYLEELGQISEVSGGWIRDIELALPDQRFVVAGLFDEFGGCEAHSIAEYSGSIEWRSLGGGTNGEVVVLQNWRDQLVAAGEFDLIGNAPAANIAVWDGQQWHALGDGLDDEVTALTTDGDRLFAAGSFTHSGDVPTSNVAVWDGSAWESLGLGCDGGIDGGINDMAFVDGYLWIGGSFRFAGGKPAWKLARVDLREATAVVDNNEPGANDHQEIAMVVFELCPNPFNPTTTINFELKVPGRVRLSVYDIRGRRVATLVDEHRSVGHHEVNWSASDRVGRELASGVYLLRLEAAGMVATRRAMLVR